MSDLWNVMWKEFSEFVGNQRSLRVFGIAVLIMGVLPALTFRKASVGVDSELGIVIRVLYVLFASAITVANTAPDLVLHERVGRTLDYLLATRLPDQAIFGGKVLVAAAAGYAAALAAIVVQLVVTRLISGGGWNWLYLGIPAGRILALAMPAALCLYVSVIGTFVALRVGDQRSAYMVTILSLGVVALPFILGWLHISITTAWFGHAALIFGAVAIALGVLGVLLFRRERLVLYLQE
jgi:hypothetical protein